MLFSIVSNLTMENNLINIFAFGYIDHLVAVYDLSHRLEEMMEGTLVQLFLLVSILLSRG